VNRLASGWGEEIQEERGQKREQENIIIYNLKKRRKRKLVEAEKSSAQPLCL